MSETEFLICPFCSIEAPIICASKAEADKCASRAYFTPDTVEGLVFAVQQSHEWGYRDLASGKFIADNTPFDLANAVEVVRQAADDTMDMALCEASSLVLRVGQRYTFRPVGDCPKCAERAAAAKDAYGPSPAGNALSHVCRPEDQKQNRFEVE